MIASPEVDTEAQLDRAIEAIVEIRTAVIRSMTPAEIAQWIAAVYDDDLNSLTEVISALTTEMRVRTKGG